MENLSPGKRTPKHFTHLMREEPLFSSLEELHEKLAELLGRVIFKFKNISTLWIMKQNS